ncbi:MAG: thioredoxin-disulfide reductase [Candidatus Pacearchaeota archaeon]
MEKEIYDVIILGGGPAGLAAAIYSSRYELKTLLISKDFGGTANLAPEIENWPGFIGSGLELMKKFKEQAEMFGAKLLEAEITAVSKSDLFKVTTDKGVFESYSLIICLGTEHRKLNIKGEKEFIGKGVSYCATCDGAFFRNKIVGVVGGANSAAVAALYLSKLAKKVYIFYRRDKMRCEPVLLTRLKEKENIEIVYNSIPLEIIGDKKVKKIKISVENVEKEIDVDGIFIEIGSVPSSKLVENLKIEMDCDGFIKTNKKMETNLEGVFAAGDITDGPFKQVITAASEGAIAAFSVHEYLTKKNFKK